MKSKNTKIDWDAAFIPLFKKYKGKKHPLLYHNPYQLIVMIVLSARASDAMVNKLSPKFFSSYPSFTHLAKAKPEELYPLLRVPGFKKKAEWIVDIARTVEESGTIPETMESLVQLKGFGRKSANVFMSQMQREPEGVIVDLHTLRVAPRLGITDESDPVKVEKSLMEKVKRKNWHLLGLSLTYLGRETCRPTHPHCHECVMNTVCTYAQKKQ
ncbi:MAG: endonuclease III domain-containing protein [Bacteroidota bacterium]